jgi:acyl-CoA reductase-like NAD-dependent aldehyde dehydrogenase
MPDLDLDVDTPEKVAEVLRRAAQRFNESASELESAWQDRNAGKVWVKFAEILERAAKSCDFWLKEYVQ